MVVSASPPMKNCTARWIYHLFLLLVSLLVSGRLTARPQIIA